MRLIDAINIVLRGVGKPAINDADSGSADKAAAEAHVDTARRKVLLHGWSFNTNLVDLEVDASGKIPVGDYLKIKMPYDHLGVRYDSGTAYVWHIENKEWYTEDMDDTEVVFDIALSDFTQIPTTFQQWIADLAAHEYFRALNQGSTSNSLENDAILAESNAINSETHQNVNTTTGWYHLAASGYGSSAPVRALGRWIEV